LAAWWRKSKASKTGSLRSSAKSAVNSFFLQIRLTLPKNFGFMAARFARFLRRFLSRGGAASGIIWVFAGIRRTWRV